MVMASLQDTSKISVIEQYEQNDMHVQSLNETKPQPRSHRFRYAHPVVLHRLIAVRADQGHHSESVGNELVG